MSVLIKGMKMPTCCDECAFIKTVGLDRWKCELSGYDFNSWDVGWGDGTDNKYIRHNGCPLVEVPTPHGRLIDADALGHIIGQFSLTWEYGQGVSDCWDALLAAPTIIEAEDGE